MVANSTRWRRRSSDRLLRSSFFLTASGGAMALLGLGFSVVITRLFEPEQVGVGMSLVSATSFIAHLSLFGLNMTIVRFYANSKDRDAQVTQILLVVGGLGLLFSGVFVVLAPFYAPALSLLQENTLYAAAFIIVGALSGINLMTDFVFIAARRPEYNLLVDGLVQGSAKLILPFALIGLGAYGIFAAVGGGYFVAVLAAVLCMRHALGFRFDFRPKLAITRAQVNYSFTSYLSDGLAVVPVLMLPLIAIRTLGDAETAYLTLALQIALVLYGVSFAIGEALFAEGSFDESRLGSLLKRSGVLLLTVQVPAVIVFVVGGPVILGFFGDDYREHGRDVLVILAVAGFAVALHTLVDFAMRLIGLMRGLVVSGLLCATVTVGVSELWGPQGLPAFGWAVLAGNLVSALYGLIAIVVHERNARRCDESWDRAGVLTISGSRIAKGRDS